MSNVGLILILLLAMTACSEQPPPDGTQAAILLAQTSVALRGTEAAGEATAVAIKAQTTQSAMLLFSNAYATQTMIPANAAGAATRMVNDIKYTARVRTVGVAMRWVFFVFTPMTVMFVVITFALARLRMKTAEAQSMLGRPVNVVEGTSRNLEPYEDTALRDKALDLLKLVMSVDPRGSNAVKIPRWDKLPGWSAESRESVVNPLQRAGALMVVNYGPKGDVGTWVKEPWSTVGRLYQAVSMGSVKLMPPPPLSTPAGNSPPNRISNTEQSEHDWIAAKLGELERSE